MSAIHKQKNNSMIFKTLNGDLTVFNKTLISTKDHLKSLQTINATVYNKNGAFNLQGLLVNSSQSVSTFTKLNNAFKAYNGNLSKSTQLQNAYVQAVGKQNVTLGNYLAGLNGAKASMGGYVKSLVAAKAASIGLQAASIALNTAISMGITLAISALISAITKWVNKEKEAREEAIENAKAAKEEANNLSELLNKYNQLSKEVKSNQGVKEDLLSVQSDLLEALGIEASQIDTLIEKYGDLNSAINQITLDSLRDAQGDLMVAIDAYEKDLIKVGKGYAHWYSLFDRNLLSTGQSSTDALDILEKAGIISSGSHGEGGGALVLTGNDKTVEGILENYQKLKDAQEALNTAIDNGEITMEEMIKIPLYNDINSRLEELEESIGNYNTAIADLNKNMAQQQILKSLAEQSSIPETKEEFEAFQQSMIDTAIASTKFKGSQDDIRDSIINVLSVMPEFKKYFEELNDVQSSTSNFENPISLSISQTVDQLNTQLKPAFDSLKSAYQDIFTDDGFTLENVDLSMLDSIRSSIEELNSMEDVNINIDYSSFENLATILTDSTSTENEVQEAMNSLATDIVSALNPAISECSGESYQMVQALLESVGVMNSEEVMVSALGYTYEEYVAAKEAATNAGIDLANATIEDIMNFANEASAANEDKIALFNYYQYKIIASGATIDTLGDVQALIEEYNQLGLNCEKLKEYLGLKGAEAGSGVDVKYRGYGNSTEGYNPGATYSPTQVEFKPISGAKKSGGGKKEKKETEEEFDWIEKKIENLEDELSRLDKVADSAYSSIPEKNEALAGSIEKINEEIELQQQAYERYMQKAESVGLSDEYKNLVRDGAVDIESITDDGLKEAIKNYEQWYNKAKETQDKINDLYDDAKDKHVAAYELEAGELEKLRDNQAITEREYLDAMLALYDKYYAANTEFANQAKEAKLKYLKEEKDYLEDVANAAASLLDDQIKDTEEEKENARKGYENQIADIEDIIKANEKEKDAIQAQIDAIKDENDELDRQKILEEAITNETEARFALERARNQRNKLLYKDGQMVWTTDDAAIKEADKKVADAQDAVDDARRDITIANLQIQIDSIQDVIDLMGDEKDRIKALADESDVFFDKKIADMQEYQNEWKEALEIEERAIALINLESMFGKDAVEQILNHNITLLSNWKQEYVDTMAAIDLASGESVGQITSQWGELAGVSIDMDHAMQLSGQSMDDLSGKAELLGTAISETADVSERIWTALGMADTSVPSEQLLNMGEAALEAQSHINGVAEKLNTLATDVQNYTIPAINSDQFTASLGTSEGDGGILGDLNTFIERFREICQSVPSIWKSAMSSISGDGGITNGESVSYGYIFKPLINAMGAAKLEIDAKLQEYADAWTQFNTDLGGIIGVGVGTDTNTNNSGTLSSPLSSKNNDRHSSTDTIVGTITAGGEASAQALDETWIPGFEGFASSIDGICESVCSMVEDMANDIIDMVNQALKALKELEAKNTGAYKIQKTGSNYSSHAVSPAHADGTLSSATGRGAIAKDQKSIVNELGNEGLVRDGVLHEIQGGTQKISLKKGDIIFNHKQMEELKRHDRVSSNGGHGKLIGSFAAGTSGNSKVTVLDNHIRDTWNNMDFKELLSNVEQLRAGQRIIIGQNNTLLKDKDGTPYPEGTVIRPNGDVLIPLPANHPTMLMQKKFEAYMLGMGGIENVNRNLMADRNKQMENMVKQVTESNVVTNNNVQPVINLGGVNITCPGVTDEQIVKQIKVTLEHELCGMAMHAYQKGMISR